MLSPRRQIDMIFENNSVARAQYLGAIADKSAWFRSLPAELRDSILAQGRVRQFTAGETLHLEGSQPLGLVLIVEGAVRLSRNYVDGGTALLHVAQPGFWAGVLQGQQKTTALLSFAAMTDCTVLALTPPQAFELAHQSVEYYAAMNQLILKRYAQIFDLWEDALNRDIQGRIARRILTDAAHDVFEPKAPVHLIITQDDIAALTGTSRQTVNRTLKYLEKRQAVRTGFRSLQIVDLERLRLICQGG